MATLGPHHVKHIAALEEEVERLNKEVESLERFSRNLMTRYQQLEFLHLQLKTVMKEMLLMMEEHK